MSWGTNTPALKAIADLLHLKLRAERLRLVSNVQAVAGQVQVLGVPKQAASALLRRKPAVTARRARPPLQHLNVRATGDF